MRVFNYILFIGKEREKVLSLISMQQSWIRSNMVRNVKSGQGKIMDEKNIDILRLYEIEKVHSYLLRYIDELNMHFNIHPEDLEKILYDCYKSVKTPTTVKKLINMVKSLSNKF